MPWAPGLNRLPSRAALQAAALVAGVLALHLMLLARWPVAQRAGTAPTGRPVLTLTRPAASPGPAPDRPGDTARAVPARIEPSSPVAPADKAPAAAVTATSDASTVGTDPRPAPAADATAVAHAPPATPAATARPGPATAAADDDSDAVNPMPQSSPATAGDPPPLYATHLPPSATLSYALRYNGLAGQARLAWTQDGSRYGLALDGRSPAGGPVVEQASDGAIDAAGLAPERFLDRRRGRGWRAAHFRREAGQAVGRISFSGPLVEYPAWPGAQDRLSWVAQLAGIVAAARTPLPQVLMFVADARGRAEGWRFVPVGDEAVDAPLGSVTTTLWRHEPLRPDGLRVEAWLDAARGHWPARLRFTALRSGDVFELLLAAEPVPGRSP